MVLPDLEGLYLCCNPFRVLTPFEATCRCIHQLGVGVYSLLSRFS